MIEAVIFDMDGLLVDSEPLWREAEIKTFERVGLNLTDDDCSLTMGWRTNEVIEYWFKQAPWKGLSVDEVETILIENVLQLIKDKAEPMPGVMKTLELVSTFPVKVAIASSSPMELINTVVDKFSIRPYFQEIRSAENEEFGKPHPGIFIHTAEALETHPTSCLVFEDSFHGLIAAKAARMKTIVVPDGKTFHEDRWIISDLKLPSLLAFNEKTFESFY